MPALDLVLHNGRVITLDARNTLAEAIGIKDGHVAAVGTSAELMQHAGRQTRSRRSRSTTSAG